MRAVPPAGRRIVEDGVLCYLAVRTPFGPHVTPVVYAADGGRLWFTTARRSVKARSWRLDPRAAGLIQADGAAVAFRGPVRTYDAFDPATWPRTMVAGPRLMQAAARFSLKNARFFAGYAVDAGRVPFAWMPPGRVFAALRPEAVAVLDGEDLSDVRGRWAEAFESRRSFSLRWERGPTLDGIPGTVRSRVGAKGSGVLAVDVGGSITVVPAAWRRSGRGSFEAVLDRRAARLTGAGPGVPAALVADRASNWRAADMAGMLFLGRAELFDPAVVTRGRTALIDALAGDEGSVLVRLRPRRVVWWEGWASGTVVPG